MARGGYLYRRAQAKGLLGGNRTWSMLWAVLFGLRILRRMTRDKPEILLRETLDPGETLIISSGEKPVRVLGGERA
jgi:hypothetical protein